MRSHVKILIILLVLIVLFTILSSPVLASDVQAIDIPTYVDTLYNGYLHRSPSEGELAAWVNAINAGVLSRTQVAYAIQNSTEYHTYYVTSSYYYVFTRVASVGEISAWVNAMNTGLTDDRFVALIIGSDEYMTKVAPTNVAYVARLYDVFCGRLAAGGEDAGWLNALNTGALTRTDESLAFAGCHEFHAYLIHIYYSMFLERDPLAVETDMWANAMDAGLSMEMLQAAILGSDEYLSKGGGFGRIIVQGTAGDSGIW